MLEWYPFSCPLLLCDCFLLPYQHVVVTTNCEDQMVLCIHFYSVDLSLVGCDPPFSLAIKCEFSQLSFGGANQKAVKYICGSTDILLIIA